MLPTTTVPIAAPSARAVAAAAADRRPPMPPQLVIRWLLVACPPTPPIARAAWPQAPVRATARAGFRSVGVCSMGLGFFAGFRGLQLGGMLRVSQIHPLQPLRSMALARPLLGETLNAVTAAFALAVMGSAFPSRRMAVAMDRAAR